VFGWFKKRPAQAAPRPVPSRPAESARVRFATPEAARELVWITVLLRDGPLAEAAGLDQMIGGSGLRALGFSATNGANLRRGGMELPVMWGQSPYPAEGLERRFAPGLTDLGAGYLSLGGSAPPEPGPPSGADQPDPWGPDGAVRAATQVAAALLASGLAVGVVVHRAGDVLYDAAGWLARAHDPLDPEMRPLGAWIDIDFGEQDLVVRGLEVMDLPAVRVLARRDMDPETYQRSTDAALFAAKLMIEENRRLAQDETLRVPLGVAVAGRPLHVVNPGMDPAESVEYRVVDEGATLLLERTTTPPPMASLWAAATAEGREVSYPVYRALLRDGLRSMGCREIAAMDFDNVPPGLPVHEVLVHAFPQGGFLMTTCGIGRRAQPNGRAEDGSAYLELAVALPAHDPLIGTSLSMLGRLVHSRTPDAKPIAAGQRVSFEQPLPPLEIGAVAFGALGAVRPTQGPPIALMTPVIMTPAEVAQVPPDRVGPWIESEGARAETLGRWMVMAQEARAQRP
jgi:hypothetical protein